MIFKIRTRQICKPLFAPLTETEYKYLKFYSPWLTMDKKKRFDPFWIMVIKFINWFFFPKENPDFDKQIDAVAEWLVEIDMKTNKPFREIGIDLSGHTIVIMPWLDNKGLWKNSWSWYSDRINPVVTDKSTFEKRWNSFVELPNHDKKGST